MESLQQLLDSSTVPALTAFLLGLVTALSPCPMATNIAAIGFIGKEIDNRHRLFISGLLYTAGRVIVYTGIGLILIPLIRAGASIYAIQHFLAQYGEKILPPALILLGLFMLFGHRLNLPRIGIRTNGERVGKRSGWGALLLGMLFALAFCPTSALFYFGMLIPMAAAETGGELLPVVFALATGLPVVITAWILAYSVSSLGHFYNRIQTIQRWLTRIVALLFIGVGIYYAIIYLL